ncbi:ABC transporter ATP-binding protein [Paraburkholderia sediminicola]|jgi:branched-chain amino acid transport system ATP-binding protein|uniref:ABC transporter ATP-binding protein n=1 Tax=Paraburkholderia sediminicola TaxID=458836 RepID=UPI0038B7075D
MLIINGMHTRIGSTPVHHDVSIEVADAEVVVILGSNGAGKTSLLRATMGLLPLLSGKVILDGDDITTLPPHARNRRGLGYVPEGRRIFGPMTVRENLEIGAYAINPPAADLEAEVEVNFNRFPILREKAADPGSTLSGGQQQMLAMGRALMSKPKLLLLDEPSLGLAPQMVRTVHDTIKMVQQTQRMAVLLVEQNAGLALAVADRVYLMARGTIVAQGTPSELAGSDVLRSVYLGQAESAS